MQRKIPAVTILGLSVAFASCLQPARQSANCLQSTLSTSKGLQRLGEIGGQLFIVHKDDPVLDTNGDSRPYCNAYVEFADKETLAGDTAKIYLYTARHCIREDTLIEATIKMNATRFTSSNYLTKVNFAEIPVTLTTVEIFRQARGKIPDDLIADYYEEFNDFRSFGSNDDMKKVLAMDASRHPKVMAMLNDLKDEKRENSNFLCEGISDLKFDYSKRQRVCFLPGDLGIFEATIPIRAEDRELLLQSVQYQDRKRAEFFAQISDAEKSHLSDWLDYLHGLNRKSFDFATAKILAECGDRCERLGFTKATDRSPSDSRNPSAAETRRNFDNQFLDHLELGLGFWNDLRESIDAFQNVYVQSNYDHESLVAPQFLSFPLSKISPDSSRPIDLKFRKYGLTYEASNAAIQFEPGDSGTMVSIGGHVPIAVLSVVNGVDTSSGLARQLIPPKIRTSAILSRLGGDRWGTSPEPNNRRSQPPIDDSDPGTGSNQTTGTRPQIDYTQVDDESSVDPSWTDSRELPSADQKGEIGASTGVIQKETDGGVATSQATSGPQTKGYEMPSEEESEGFRSANAPSNGSGC